MRLPALESHGLVDEAAFRDAGVGVLWSGQAATRRRRRSITIGILVLSDVAALSLAGLAALAVTGFPPMETVYAMFATFPPVFGDMVQLGLLALLCFVALAAERLYDPDELGWGSGQLTRTARAITMGIVGFVLVSYVIGLASIPHLWVLVAWASALLFVMGGRLAVRDVMGRFEGSGVFRRRTLIVGSNHEAADVTRSLARPGTGLLPVGCVSSQVKDQLSLDYTPPSVPSLGSPREIAEVVRRDSIDTVVIVASAFDYEVLDRIISDLRGLEVSIRMATGLSNVLTSRVLVGEASGIPLITVKSVSFTPGQLAFKRAFDLLAASVAIVLTAPVWLLLMGLIKLTSRGPVFYTQLRLGKDGVPFRMYKFRSMVQDAERRRGGLRDRNEADGPLFKMKDDPRTTPVGRFMRRFSLDELPQLVNVLRGEMGLVGPRPPLPREAALYTDKACRRFEVLPGITGLWQVSGRSDLSFDEMIDLDLFYIENWSVFLDLSMIARTVPAVLSSRGAY